MLDRVSEFLTRYNMLNRVGRLGIAVSGGADSVCLLLLLHELAPRFGFQASVIHLNHQLRGEESTGDAAFVLALANRLGLPCYSEAAKMEEFDSNLEQAGRKARLNFFRRLRESGAVDVVATGHTLSDQAETILYRLFRGAGLSGLSGIQPVADTGLIRPLLCVRRQEVEEYLRACGQAWREDGTNSDPRFQRNRLRNELIPALEQQFNPRLVDVLAGTATLAREEEQFWTQRTAKLAGKVLISKGNAVLLRIPDLRDLFDAETRRLLRYAAEIVRGDLRELDFAHFEAMLALTRQPEGHGRVQLPRLDVFRSFEWLRLAPIRTTSRAEGDYSFLVTEPGEYQLPHSRLDLQLCERTADVSKGYNDGGDWIDPGLLAGRLEIRNWHPGDALDLVSGPERLKSLFQKWRVPVWDRHQWPVVSSGERILWTRHYGTVEWAAPKQGVGRALRLVERCS